jgi:acetyltransferase
MNANMHHHYLSPLFEPGRVWVYLPRELNDDIAILVEKSVRESAFDGDIEWVRKGATGFDRDGGALVGDQRPDLALIALPGPGAVDALKHAASHRVKAAVIYHPIEEHEWIAELMATARVSGIYLMGPSSSGVQRPRRGLNACIAGPIQASGHLGLISQSGALTAAMLDWAQSNGVKFSAVVSPGRSAMLDLADMLDFLAQDAQTHSIVMYMEGIRDARRFMSTLRAAARSKPIIVLKAGRREMGHRAALTHSGTIVGGDDVFDAALQRAGVVRVESFVQLFSAAKCLAARYRPIGNRLAVISNGGGPGVLAADYAYLRGVDIPVLSDATRRTLMDILPNAVSVDNPVDLGEWAQPADFVAATEMLAASPDIDGVLVTVTPKPGVDTDAIAALAIERLPRIHRTVIACWMGETRVAATRRAVNEAGLPMFRLPEAAVDAFANIASFHRNQQLLLQSPPPLSLTALNDAPDLGAARTLIADVLAQGRHALTETESKALLAAFRIPVARTQVARTPEEAVAIAHELGFPVAMKINSPDILHKSDVGGVMLNVRTENQVRAVYADMLEEVARRAPGARVEGIALQPMVIKRHGRELYVGMTTDVLFGPVITFGAGGTLIEVIDDRSVSLPPLNQFLARRMIERARTAAVLGEWRGMPAVDVEALQYLLLRVSEMICELPELRELDINPVILDEDGAAVVDARAVVGLAPPGTGPYRHMAILPYPADLSRELTLKDGLQCALRAIRPEDAESLQAFTKGLSDEARYFRFLSALAELTPSMLARFTQIDYDREMAIVATVMESGREKIIGVARYVLNPDAESGEFGLVVADRFQGRGLGSALMQRLAEVAKARGLKSLVGLILSHNSDMLSLMKRLGFVEAPDPDDPDLKRAVKTL